MKRPRLVTMLAVSLALALSPTSAVAQPHRDGPIRKEIGKLMKSIEKKADKFRRSSNRALDRSELNGTKGEKDLKRYIKDFENATDRLRDRFEEHKSTKRDAEEVLRRGKAINVLMFLSSDGKSKRDWSRLRKDLHSLSKLYRVKAGWTR